MLPNSRTKKGHVVLNQHDLFDRCLSNHRHCLRCGASVREAHLRVLSSASLQFTPVLDLFFCSDATKRLCYMLRGVLCLVFGHSYAAKRISVPCRPLRCSLPRFWNCFSAATPTKRLCHRLRGGSCMVFGHSYAAKRISESCRPLRCSLPRFWSCFSVATPTKRLCYRLRWVVPGFRSFLCSEAHLRVLASASLPLKPVLELFFCSDAHQTSLL